MGCFILLQNRQSWGYQIRILPAREINPDLDQTKLGKVCSGPRTDKKKCPNLKIIKDIDKKHDFYKL